MTKFLLLIFIALVLVLTIGIVAAIVALGRWSRRRRTNGIPRPVINRPIYLPDDQAGAPIPLPPLPLRPDSPPSPASGQPKPTTHGKHHQRTGGPGPSGGRSSAGRGAEGGGAGWNRSEEEATTVARMDLAAEFPELPASKLAWAQEFVDAALAHSGATAVKHDDGVKFAPNFVLIERIYTRDTGFLASLYGTPHEYRRRGFMVRPGRRPGYSRIAVRSREELDRALEALHIAHKLKGT